MAERPREEAAAQGIRERGEPRRREEAVGLLQAEILSLDTDSKRPGQAPPPVVGGAAALPPHP